MPEDYLWGFRVQPNGKITVREVKGSYFKNLFRDDFAFKKKDGCVWGCFRGMMTREKARQVAAKMAMEAKSKKHA